MRFGLSFSVNNVIFRSYVHVVTFEQQSSPAKIGLDRTIEGTYNHCARPLTSNGMHWIVNNVILGSNRRTKLYIKR